MPTSTLGRSLALGMTREGPMRLPLAFVPTQRLCRLAGRSAGIVTKPYDLTLMQVICTARYDYIAWPHSSHAFCLRPGRVTQTWLYSYLSLQASATLLTN